MKINCFSLFSIAALSVSLFSFDPVSAVPTRRSNEVKSEIEDSVTIHVPYRDIRGQTVPTFYNVEKSIAEQSQFLKEKMENDQTSISITESEVPDLVNASHQLGMKSMLKTSLKELCRQFPMKSAEELVILEPKIPKDYFEALLHCFNENPPKNWIHRELAIQKRGNFHKECELKDVNFAGGSNLVRLLNIRDPSSKCLNYIKENNLNLVLYSILAFKTLEIVKNNADILKLLDMKSSINLSQYRSANAELIYEAMDILPNLVQVDFSRVGSLDMSKFPDMAQLKMLTIMNCELQNLESFFQKDFPQLNYLFLTSNKIKAIPEIKSMQNLQLLSLNKNEIEDVTELFKSNLPELKSLDLENNNLANIPAVNVDLMPNLRKISIKQNCLKNIDQIDSKIDVQGMKEQKN